MFISDPKCETDPFVWFDKWNILANTISIPCTCTSWDVIMLCQKHTSRKLSDRLIIHSKMSWLHRCNKPRAHVKYVNKKLRAACHCAKPSLICTWCLSMSSVCSHARSPSTLSHTLFFFSRTCLSTYFLKREAKRPLQTLIGRDY